MKKIFVTIALAFLFQISNAQDANFKADVLKLISISGADSQIKIVKPQILNMIADNKKESFSKEFDASIPTLYDKMIAIYIQLYTQEDIKGMIAFYESPVGKKMSEKSAELLQQSMKAGQEWGQGLFAIVEKYKNEAPEQNKYELIKPKK